MSKKIVGEDGKTYIQKKPFYKRVWFWILVVIVIIIFGGAIGGNSNSNSSDSASSSKSTSKTSSSKTEKKVPAQYTAALNKADTYAKNMNMSKKAVYNQLTSESGEGFSKAAADYAMSNLSGVDWNKNALEKAKSYQKDQNMSTSAIKTQLTSDAGEQFTVEQAQYAIDNLNK